MAGPDQSEVMKTGAVEHHETRMGLFTLDLSRGYEL
jgi:hypothetical protein